MSSSRENCAPHNLNITLYYVSLAACSPTSKHTHNSPCLRAGAAIFLLSITSWKATATSTAAAVYRRSAAASLK
ncbi:hypothetical protein E2C01_039904 [Portunus trituberculatus]|uniref:Uncharacterized protein n=1 Tax=Portunus trituberculatus TaxID=210409 RepID=A0A5B7FI78_PORTR|nr:hypothetical protein [Portunus trituberculatus]